MTGDADRDIECIDDARLGRINAKSDTDLCIKIFSRDGVHKLGLRLIIESVSSAPSSCEFCHDLAE